MTVAKISPSESEIQIALFEWAGLNIKKCPDLEFLHHTANGGYRNIVTAKRLKKEGVKPGVPDICLPTVKNGYHGLYIELKAIGGCVSDSQAKWLNYLKKQGYFAVAAYGYDEAKGFIERYLETE